MTKGLPDWMKPIGIKREVPTKTMRHHTAESMGIEYDPYSLEKTGISGWVEEIHLGIQGGGANWTAFHIEVYKDGETTAFLDLYGSDFLGGVNIDKNVQIIGDYFSLFHYDATRYEAVLRFNTKVRFEDGFKLRFLSTESAQEIKFWAVIFWEQEIT